MEQSNDNQKPDIKTDFDKAARNEFPILYALAVNVSHDHSPFKRRRFKSLEALDYMVEQAHNIAERLKKHSARSLSAAPMQERFELLGRVMCIGEKANRGDQTNREINEHIPWMSLINLRHALAHHMSLFVEDDMWEQMSYFFIEEFPALKTYLEEMAEDLRMEAERKAGNDNDPPDSNLNYVA